MIVKQCSDMAITECVLEAFFLTSEQSVSPVHHYVFIISTPTQSSRVYALDVIKFSNPKLKSH